MATIVTRAGKGSALTHTEMDANFNNLNEEVGSAVQNTGNETIAGVKNFTDNVGIGTSSPQRPLHISSSVPCVRLQDTDVSGLYHEILSGGSAGYEIRVDEGNVASGSYFRVDIDNSEKIRIDSAGKLLSPNGSAFVGTVSNSGNGAIIERGSNANGEYVKYADGTMICTIMNSVNTTLGLFGNVYIANVGFVNFPATFSQNPTVTSGASHASGFGYYWSGGNLVRTGYTQLRLFSAAAASSQDLQYSIIAIGRWY